MDANSELREVPQTQKLWGTGAERHLSTEPEHQLEDGDWEDQEDNQKLTTRLNYAKDLVISGLTHDSID